MADVQAGIFATQLLFSGQPQTPVANQDVNVYAVGTTTASNVYTDHISGTAATNPVLTDAEGNLTFFAVPGDYDIVYTWGNVLVRQTVTVDPPSAAIAVTTPTLTLGTALQNTTAYDQTWLIAVTQTGTGGTAAIAIGTTSSVATALGTFTVAASAVQLFTVPVPAGWFCKVTDTNAASNVLTVLNRA